MSEQDSGSDRTGAFDDPDAAGAMPGAGPGSPAGDRPAAAPTSAPAPTSTTSVRFDDDRDGAGVRVGRVVRTITNVVAVLVRLVACLFAVVLLVRVGLAFVAVNPHNVIVEGIDRFADAIVWDFRDLFLPADPRTGLVVNYGLAAVFWLVVGLLAAWGVSSVGRLVTGGSRN
ncbi:MAG TPA: hypothetical protein VGE11_04825 [Pseudonocardia sp.]